MFGFKLLVEARSVVQCAYSSNSRDIDSCCVAVAAANATKVKVRATTEVMFLGTY